MEKHSLPPIAAEPDLAARDGEIRAPERAAEFDARHAREVRP